MFASRFIWHAFVLNSPLETVFVEKLGSLDLFAVLPKICSERGQLRRLQLLHATQLHTQVQRPQCCEV
jgi:hypothetical protein